jgi:hypothetical protein
MPITIHPNIESPIAPATCPLDQQQNGRQCEDDRRTERNHRQKASECRRAARDGEREHDFVGEAQQSAFAQTDQHKPVGGAATAETVSDARCSPGSPIRRWQSSAEAFGQSYAVMRTGKTASGSVNRNRDSRRAMMTPTSWVIRANLPVSVRPRRSVMAPAQPGWRSTSPATCWPTKGRRDLGGDRDSGLLCFADPMDDALHLPPDFDHCDPEGNDKDQCDDKRKQNPAQAYGGVFQRTAW